MTNHTWTLSEGRTITTPDGEFYLAYGKEAGSNRPKFQNFAKLDKIAHQVAAIPELLEALERTLQLAIGHACEARKINETECESWSWVQRARSAIAKAKGE